MTPKESAAAVYSAVRAISKEVVGVLADPSPKVRRLTIFIDRLQKNFTEGATGLTYLQSNGLKPDQITALLRMETYNPPPDLNASLGAIQLAGQAVVASYVKDVWPLFEGKAYVFDPKTGLHSELTVSLPDTFKAKLSDLATALAAVA